LVLIGSLPAATPPGAARAGPGSLSGPIRGPFSAGARPPARTCQSAFAELKTRPEAPALQQWPLQRRDTCVASLTRWTRGPRHSSVRWSRPARELAESPGRRTENPTVGESVGPVRVCCGSAEEERLRSGRPFSGAAGHSPSG
jgi:hypothetical protein